MKDNLQPDVAVHHDERRVWTTPVVITASASNDTDHAANTVSDGTGNLFS